MEIGLRFKLVFRRAVSEPAGEHGKNIETGTAGQGRLRGFSVMICVKCGGESDHQRQNKSPVIHNGCYRAFKVSRQRESNPPPQLGKLIYYRCTTAASLTFLIISLLFGLVK